MEYNVKIISIKDVTHNVKSFTIEKPPGYYFQPGNATEVSINKKGWENEKRPFTFTSLITDPFLEFVIKIYRDHDGVTNMLGTIKAGEYLTIGDAWGAIEYKGPGYFIAGGSGITPFIAILRHLRATGNTSGNKLFFSNRTSKDIILRSELTKILGSDAIFTLTNEDNTGYDNRIINEAFLKTELTDFKKHFYVCGPPQMTLSINESLTKLGATAEAVVFEK